MVGNDSADVAKLTQTGMSGKTMKLLARNSKLALLGLSGMLALPVGAETLGIYGGIQAGYSSTDTNKDVIEFDRDEIYGIYGGYKFLDWLGVEAGYARLGNFEVDTFMGEDVNQDVMPIEIDGWYAALSLWGPFIGPVGAFAKLGVHFSESRLEKNDETGNDYSATSTNLYYSIGLDVPVVENVSVTLAYQNYRNIDILDSSDDEDLGDAGVDAVTLGVLK